MDGRRGPFHASFPLGTWLGVRVQLSVWFPVLFLILLYQFGLREGLIVSLLLTLSVILHEFFHVFAARGTGGSADEIVLWPAGGLAYTRPGPTIGAQLTTILAGPFSNLLTCALLLPVLLREPLPAGLFHPVELANVALERNFWHDVAVLAFDLNWALLLLNLLPVNPLDGGQAVLVLLAQRYDRETARFGALRIGMAVGMIAAVMGLLFTQVWLVFIGFLLFCMNMYEFFQSQLSDQMDDSFLGYDFSQGYTSLERSQGRDKESRPTKLQQWRQRRAEERRKREEEERTASEQRMDELLDKVHQHGISALTDAERRFLERESIRYRGQPRPGGPQA